MLTIRGLSKTFSGRPGQEPAQALDQVDIDVAEGQFATILGPSGCGKTTLLRSIAGFEDPSAGTISIDGREVAANGRSLVSAHERGVGIVPQDGALFPHLSVAQNIGFGLTGQPRRERNRRVAEVLELVGLDHLGSRRPHELSGGQQQRVALARAIAPNPRVILLDEPFSALDAYLRQSLREEVRNLLRDIGATVVLVTHDQAEAMTLADHLVVMRHGKVVQAGKPRETYFRPCDIELARFLGDAVVVDGDIPCGAATGTSGSTVSCAFGELAIGSWHGRPGLCDVLIRPENITVRGTGEGVGLPGVVGTVVDQSFYGHDGVLQVAIPQLPERVPVRVMGDQAFDVGQSVTLSVDRAVCTY
ncbi:ABC transporter ATP-binding protein [Arthrobacter rhombi]|uniref:ABC transporter ATP-binding protein n=1 Tax=Arthrobacter rhombi TaxID=71253 RepID=UPI000B35FD5B|nr:ABC transporter ATP-binding protein [Arthrobacter rhombi]